MSRTVSARISKETHDQLRERCNKAGCTMNDWIEASINYFLTGYSDFDFGDDEEKEDENEPKASSTTEPAKTIITKIVD